MPSNQTNQVRFTRIQMPSKQISQAWSVQTDMPSKQIGQGCNMERNIEEKNEQCSKIVNSCRTTEYDFLI
jgi:hypothetical protein